ncbi:fibronectin type III domain-containing protein [Halorussus salinus]|uniref:fibronectin type III domain-containing protein n=1 Tax=Halorussus salinus TaxID=1364935 RepID=UPI001092E705|nr:fibronectin type III domain-containing protein [Halorussus salinus]
MVSVQDDFEDGDVAEWTNTAGGWKADTATYGGGDPYEGSYAGVADGIGQVEVAGTLVTADLSGGYRPATFGYYFEEDDTSYGGGLRLRNSNGNHEVGMATDNPEWYYSGGDGIGQFYGGDGYSRWIEVIISFDWGNSEYALEVSDLQSGTTQTHAGSLRQGVDIETVVVSNFSSGAWGSGSNYRMAYDYLYLEKRTPDAPSEISLSISGDDASVSWSDNSTDEDGFHVDKYYDGSWSRVADVGANTTSCSESNLLDGEQYRYRVRAYNSAGASDWVDSNYATTALPAPSSTSLTIDSPTSGTATWTDNSDNETNFDVNVEQDGTWADDSTPDAGTESTAVSFDKSADELRVAVRAQTEHTSSDWAYSNTHRTTVSGASVDATRSNEIDLSWTAVDQADGYYVYRAESSGSSTADYSRVADLTAGTTSWTDTSLENGERYFYRVAAYYGGTADTLSDETSGVTDLPSAAGVSIDDSVEDELSLNWDKNDNSSDGDWEILRSTDGSTGTVVATVSDLTQTSYTGARLTDGEKYYYTVRRNTDHASTDSGQNSAVTVLPAPTGLTVDSISGDQATVSWTPNHDYGDQRVEVKPTDASSWTVDADNIGRTTSQYTTSNLLDGEEYDLRVVAYTDHTETEDQ